MTKMQGENIVDVDVDSERISELMEEESVTLGGKDSPLGKVVGDIQTAHAELDEFKAGSLSLAQTLSEAADDTEDEALQAVLMDMSDGAFGVYLRLHRGDKELLGDREGEYSGFLAE